MRVICPANVRPWKKIGEPRTLATSHGLVLGEQDFQNPADETIHAYSFANRKNGVIICPITSERKILIVRQYKQGIGEIVYEFPAGWSEQSECAKTAANRELLEETGFQAKRTTYVGRLSVDARKSASLSIAFVATNCINTGNRNLDSAEEIEVVSVSIDELWDMIQTQQIIDMSTIATATLAKLHGYL